MDTELLLRSSKSPARFCKWKRDRFIQRCTGWSRRVGLHPNGQCRTLIGAFAITRLRREEGGNLPVKNAIGGRSPQP